MQNPWVVVGVITVLLFGGAILYSSILAEKSSEGAEISGKSLEISANIKGDPESPVKIVEYSDFQCPACASFQPVLQELENLYPGQFSLEFKHFPLPMHPHALPAAVASEAAGQQGKFFEFHDLLFANQQEWSSAVAPSVFFVKYAEQLGLDVDLFREHQKSTFLRDKVRADLNAGREMGVDATPTFYLNGQKMTFGTFEEFVSQIGYAIDPEAVTETGGSGNVPEVKFGL